VNDSTRRSRRQDLPELILDAAQRCFERWGIQRTRVEDIANEAQMPRPHVYRHYSSKEAIVHAVVLRAIRRHHVRLSNLFPLEGPARELIINTLLSGLRDTSEDIQGLTREDSARITAQSLAESDEITAALREHWRPILEHARSREELRPSVDLDAATRWLVFIQLSLLSLGSPDPSTDIAETLSDFVLPALLTNA